MMLMFIGLGKRDNNMTMLNFDQRHFAWDVLFYNVTDCLLTSFSCINVWCVLHKGARLSLEELKRVKR